MHDSGQCRFCQLANGTIGCLMVYQNEHVACFLDKDPISRGHTLVVPKKPYRDVDELDFETAVQVMKASMLISKALKAAYRPDGITIMQNGGAFNDVGHYHLHVFCRYHGDGFGWTFGTEDWSEFCSKQVQEQLSGSIVSVQRTPADA
jgi:histidine triad (HIT) family protein